MGIHEQAMHILKLIYDIAKNRPYMEYELDRTDFYNLPKNDQNEIQQSVDYLLNEGYLVPHIPRIGLVISCKLTPKGIQYIEGITQSNQQPLSFTINGNNYGIFGNQVTGNTVNNSCTFEDVKRQVDETVIDETDKKEIMETLNRISMLMEMDAPIEKGAISKISGKLEKYQSLVAPFISFFLGYFSTPR